MNKKNSNKFSRQITSNLFLPWPGWWCEESRGRVCQSKKLNLEKCPTG